MGGALTGFGFGTPGINPTQSPFGTPWGAGPYGTQAPQQLLHSLQQLLQLEYVQQQQLLQLLPQKIQQLQQIQHLIQLVAQPSYQMHQGPFPISPFGGAPGWLGTQGVQPQIFGGQAGYVM